MILQNQIMTPKSLNILYAVSAVFFIFITAGSAMPVANHGHQKTRSINYRRSPQGVVVGSGAGAIYAVDLGPQSFDGDDGDDGDDGYY